MSEKLECYGDMLCVFGEDGYVFCQLSNPRPKNDEIKHERLRILSPEMKEQWERGKRFIRAVNAHGPLVQVVQMAYDAQTLAADEYERKYYPDASPQALLVRLKAALALAGEGQSP